jgi:hypothetical protein
MKTATHKDKRKEDNNLYRLKRNTEYQFFENYGVSVEFYDKYRNKWLQSIVSRSNLIPIKQKQG